MKIIITLFGKPKNKNILELVEDYKKRISKYQKVEIDYFPIIQNAKPNECLNKVLEKYKNSKIYLLDEDGKEYSSLDFAKVYEKELNNSTKEIVFAIGPSEGFGDLVSLKKGQVEIISLSKMVMQHDLAFLVLIEQIYRAISLKNNLPYHKA
jgi:23S rRNA (pseudouridine1915-N3)-methyltransferase